MSLVAIDLSPSVQTDMHGIANTVAFAWCNQGRIDPNGKRACNSRIDSANGKIQMRPPDILFLDIGM